MKRIILISLFVFSVDCLFAQKQGIELIDSLKSKLLSSVDDTGKVRLLGKLSFQYFQFDTDSGIYYAEKAINLAEKLQWKTGLAFSYNYMGVNYGVKGNYPKALEYFNKSLTKYTEIGDKQGIAFLSNNLGNFYRIQKEYTKAIEFFNNALIINKELNNKMNLAKNYLNLGLVYSVISNFLTSNDCYYKGLAIAQEIDNQELVAQILNNIAENKMKMKEYCEALELGIKAIKISEELNITYDHAVYNRYVGEIYFRISGDTEAAKNCLYYSNNKQKNLFYAKKYLSISIELLDKINDQALLSEASLLLSQVYEKLGDAKNALIFYKKYSANKDSVFSKDNEIKIANIEKKQEVDLRDKQIEIQTLEIEKKNLQIISQIVLFTFILFLLFLISYFYYKKQKKQKEIKAELERKKADKALRESEEKFKAIANYAASWEAWFNPEGKLLWMNSFSINLTGYTPDEYIAAKDFIPMIVEEESIPLFSEKFKEALHGSSGDNLELQIMRKDSSKFWVSVSWRPILDTSGRSLGFRTSTQDITGRKLAERELIKAKEKAEESDRLKIAFLQNMSHEVRTPLNAIAGFSQLMAKPNQSAKKLKKFSTVISESSEKLIGIITDVVEISQIHAHQVKAIWKEFDIIGCINTIVTNFTEKAQEKNINLLENMNIPCKEYFIISDEEKLERIFTHLIDNAVKFTSQGSIEITCEHKQENLLFAISDTGIGITEEMQNIIFEPFRQVETGMARNYGGNGLGLAIAKAYIELLNGSITLQSEINKGTTFFVLLPTRIGSQSTNRKIWKKNYSINTLLIAEDEYSNYEYLLELLEETQIKILYVSNGQQAIDLCRTNKDINLILMDIKMPIMDGHTAAKLIKEFRPDLPIIAQTAYALENEKINFSDIFDDYITKPINEVDLKQKLMKYIL